MRRKQRRKITRLASYLLLLSILSFSWYLISDALSQNSSKRAVMIALEEKRILKEVEKTQELPVVQASAQQMGAVLSSTTPPPGTGAFGCGIGQRWAWSCDATHYDFKKGLTYMKGEPPPSAAEEGVIFLKKFKFAKGADGLFHTDSASTSKGICSILERFTATAWLCDKDNPMSIEDKQIGFCFAQGEPLATLAEISFSQPILPGTLAGSDVSIRQVIMDNVVTEGYNIFAKFDIDVLANKTPEELEAFCGDLTSEKGQTKEYTNIRGMDTYGATGSSKGGGEDLVPFLMSYCNSRAPGQSAEDIKEVFREWQEEKPKNLTAMIIAHANNEWNDKAGMYVSGAPSPGTSVYRKRMVKEGFGGLVSAGVDFLGANVYQPRNVSFLDYAQLGGSSPGTRYVADQLSAPQFTSKVLQKKLSNVDVARPGETSSTVISNISGKFTQQEAERSTIIDAIFGGIYYIPTSLVDTMTRSTLSYHQDSFSSKQYSCDLKKNDCTLIKARSHCSGLLNVDVELRLKQLYLSAVNDTSQYAALRPDDMASAYVRAGAKVGSRNISPQGTIEDAYLGELVLYSGLASTGCAKILQESSDAIPVSDPRKLTEKEREYIGNLDEELKFKRQAILVTPVNVRYQVPALYEVDLGEFQGKLGEYLSISINRLAQLLFGGDPDWKYRVEMVEGEVIKPALISFKMDNVLSGMQGQSPATNKMLEEMEFSREDEILSYLERLNIKKMTQARIDCGMLTNDDPEEEKEFGFWFCSTDNSDGILTTCH